MKKSKRLHEVAIFFSKKRKNLQNKKTPYKIEKNIQVGNTIICNQVSVVSFQFNFDNGKLITQKDSSDN